ncbi:pyruvate oxidase, partial [Bacillus vallismortis]|nr:pyruvate oxidase [Bacillus vallismortis]
DETEADTPLIHQQVVARLEEAEAVDAVISVDVGTVTVWMARHFKLKANVAFVVSSWLASGGGGVAGAGGAGLGAGGG